MKNNEILNKIKNAVEENENNCESIMMRAFQDFVKKKVAVSENDKKDDNVKRTYEESIQDKFEEMKKSNEDGKSKREEMKQLIKKMKEGYDNIDINIFNSVQNVNLDTIISYRKGNEFHHFLEDFRNN